jgi:hypothetical protein
MGHETTPAMSWREYIASLVLEHGTLAALALKLSLAEGVEADAATVERALRRLRTKEHQDGGQYGRWLLRTFGMPQAVEHRAKWMGVYHSRFTDLPVSLCLDQLRLWDRPPLAESRTRTWLELGFATCALRLDDLAGARAHLTRARGGHGTCAARIETRLLDAYLASRRKDGGQARAILEEIEASLHDPELEADEKACLAARWLDQRAYQHLHPAGTSAADIDAARRLYERIATRDAPFFAACKRESGLAYVCFRLGDAGRAVEHAENACRHAGDGGFVRLRIATLGLLAHILGAPRGDAVRARAMRAARYLEDEDLLTRLGRAESRDAES